MQLSKKEVEKLTREILEAYKVRLGKNDWLSHKGKETALKKLEKLQIRVGYPDNIEEYPDNEYKIKSTKDGGNLIAYRAEFCKRYFEEGAKLLRNSEAADKTAWNMLPQTVNAMYEPSSNSITIPMGILREPFYSINASRERNLGGIGSVIAHEISHALDTVGAQFDENGNLNEWWQAEDKKAFDMICQKVEKEYDSIEIIQGFNVDGGLTLSENMADIAGMACILDIAGTANKKLGELFEGYAQIWRIKSTDNYTKMMLKTDTHAPDKVRVNRVLSNFEAFQDYYQVLPDDRMYLPSVQRIQIWNR